MAAVPLSPTEAAAVLQAGGVIAYPTEGVWGLGCDPFREDAVRRLLAIKQRPGAKGLIVIGAEPSQALPWLDWEQLPAARRAEVLASWPGPNTWLLPCRATVPEWLRGAHDTLAVRIVAHPVAAALCLAFGGLVVSTSANRSGEAPARHLADLPADLLVHLDGWVTGETGGRDGPSIIRDARSGEVVRG